MGLGVWYDMNGSIFLFSLLGSIHTRGVQDRVTHMQVRKYHVGYHGMIALRGSSLGSKFYTLRAYNDMISSLANDHCNLL